MAKRIIQLWEPVDIEIEPARVDPQSKRVEAEPFRISVQVKRLTVGEAETFKRLWSRALDEVAPRMVMVRRPGEEMERTAESALPAGRLMALRQLVPAMTADEALPVLKGLLDELVPTDQFVVPDEEIERRRRAEMSPDEQARYEHLVKEDADAYAKFLSEALSCFVRVAPDQLAYEVDGQVIDVENGQQLALCYGGRRDITHQIALAVKVINEMQEAQKNAFRSRFDSKPTSNDREPMPPVTGTSTAPTAAPVAVWASATPADAMPTEGSPSGPTENS